MDLIKTEGIFHRNKNGSGYVTVIREGVVENIPLVVSYENDVYEGDSVCVVIQTGKRSSKKTIGKLDHVILRAQDYVIGTFRVVDGKPYVIPDSYIPFRIRAQFPDDISCTDGDKVVAEICKYRAVAALRVKPIKTLGRSDSCTANLLAAVYGTPHFCPFSKEAEKAARDMRPIDAKQYIGKRVDLRTKPVFTFSDSTISGNSVGYSVSESDGCVKVGIHVIDIAEYLHADSILDNEACKRGRSILNGVDCSPMLPLPFLNTICSLDEKNEYLSISVFVTYDKLGNVIDTDIQESVISPILTATAEDVDILISDSDSWALMPLRVKYASIADMISTMYELAATLRAKRISEGGVDFDLCELSFGADSQGKVKYMTSEYKNDSYLMINELLLSACSALGDKAVESGIQCVFSASSEIVWDDVTGVPENKFILDNEDYKKSGWTKKEANVSRGTIYEKYCYTEITSIADRIVPSRDMGIDYASGYRRLCSIFRATDRISDIINQRAIKAWLRGEPFDIRKYLVSIETEKRVSTLIPKVERILTTSYLDECRKNGKKLNGTVLKCVNNNAYVYLDCGALGILPNGKLADGAKVSVYVTGVGFDTERVILKSDEPNL